MIDSGLIAHVATRSGTHEHLVTTTPNRHGTVDVRCTCGKTFAGQPWDARLAKRLGHAHAANPDATTVQLLSFLVLPETL